MYVRKYTFEKIKKSASTTTRDAYKHYSWLLIMNKNSYDLFKSKNDDTNFIPRSDNTCCILV